MGEWSYDSEVIILSRVNYIEDGGQLYLYSLYLLRFEFKYPSFAGTLTNSGLDVILLGKFGSLSAGIVDKTVARILFRLGV